MATRAQWHPDVYRRTRYTRVAIWLHWIIAALILFNLATGFFHESLLRGTIPFHISSGITILALSLFRIVWRLTHRPPPFPAEMRMWERVLARIVHFCLYAAMLLVPLSGWAMISANPPPGSPGAAAAAAERAEHAPPGTPMAPPRRRPRLIWGVIPLPMIAPLQEIGRMPAGLPAQRAKHEQIEGFHLRGGFVFLFLLFFHIGGALKHQFVDRRRELARMGIGRPEVV